MHCMIKFVTYWQNSKPNTFEIGVSQIINKIKPFNMCIALRQQIRINFLNLQRNIIKCAKP